MRGWLAFLSFAAASVGTPCWSQEQGPPPPDTFKIHVIDVGTGLAIFVEGHDFTLLYDSGSVDYMVTGEGNLVLAYLQTIRRDLQVIDHLILSHPHIDHSRLIPDMLLRYQVRNVWNTGSFNAICSYRRFLVNTAAEPGVAYHDALGGPGTYSIRFAPQTCEGDRLPGATVRVPRSTQISNQPIPLGKNASMTVLQARVAPQATNLDEVSMVVRLQLGARSILLPGDAGAGIRGMPSDPPLPGSAEARLLSCCASQLRSDILVAGAHGSRSSSRGAFLDAVNAKHYIVSSGPSLYAMGSMTRLPDLDVIVELEKRGTVWRTDINDEACRTNPAKTGVDNDGKPGGCDNVRIVIDPSGVIDPGYYRRAD